MLVRHRTLILDPETIKCVELVDVKNVLPNRQDILIHYRSHSLKPRLKNATMADFDAIWALISGPRGVEHKAPEETKEVSV